MSLKELIIFFVRAFYVAFWFSLKIKYIFFSFLPTAKQFSVRSIQTSNFLNFLSAKQIKTLVMFWRSFCYVNSLLTLIDINNVCCR